MRRPGTKGIETIEPLKDESRPAEPNALKNAFKPFDTKSKAPANLHQQRVVVFGFVMIALGAIIWLLINFTVGLTIAASGSLVIAYGSLVRI